MKSIKLFAVVISLSTTSIAWAGGGGSVGTGGGADWFGSVSRLIPRSVQYLYKELNHTLLIGNRLLWGTISGPTWVDQYDLIIRNERESLSSDAYTQNCFARFNYQGKLYSMATEPGCKEVYPYLNRQMDNFFVKWGRKQLNFREYQSELDQIFNQAFHQLDFQESETIRSILFLERMQKPYFGAIRCGFLCDFGFSKGSPVEHMEKQLIQESAAIQKRLTDQSKTVVDADGKCDLEKFQQLRTSVRNWDLGSRRHLARIRRALDFDFSQETQNTLQKQRIDLQIEIEDHVLPYCSENELGNNLELLFEEELPERPKD